ncbi:hypothetical protein FPV67DRAFT_1663053 [Lyophyllum atratum]|nr:hypothetical protein FPV67DRAFT_1663053 [Lyophyllum atratum]
MAASYTLPSHPSLTSIDPLGITDSEIPTVWEVISSSISSFRPRSTLLQLPNLIEDLAYSIHGNGNVDTSFLRHFVLSHYPDPLEDTPQTILNEILEHALALPTLFPEHEMFTLSPSHSVETLTPQHIKSLVAHQLLGTFTPPKSNTWGCTFLCWYSEPQPLRNAVNGYLMTIFHFFHLPQLTARSIYYQYYDTKSLQLELAHESWQTCEALLFDHLIIESTSATNVRFPHDTLKCMLIASNKSPGFGASCTQEELITGACPALLPLGALFVSPPVPDDAVLLAQRIRPLSAWKGRGRDAHATEYVETDREYTFLLLDALELDHKDPLVPLLDLSQQNLIRELTKAYTGFYALSTRDITDIASPLWGAGAFGGDPIIKSIILAMAGARAGVKVWLSVDEAQTFQNGEARVSKPSDPKVIDVLRALKRKCAEMTVAQAWTKLMTDEARRCLDGKDFAEML